MVWQLLASVLAHPLPVAMGAHADVDHVTDASMVSNDCPHHHQQAATDGHPVTADQRDTGHACHSGCKCPCAGTPALMFVLPTLPVAVSEHPLGSADFHSLPSAPVASLLRPPIT
jgi:hypothetical protein